MTSPTQSISRSQFDLLHGFFVHVWSANFDGTKLDHAFYAQELDNRNISWNIQNQVANSAEERTNKFIYFSTVLENIGVTVDFQTVH